MWPCPTTVYCSICKIATMLVRRIDSLHDLDSNHPNVAGRRQAASSYRRSTLSLSQGVCRARASRGIGRLIECGLAHADSGLALPLVRNLRRPYVARVAVEPASA